MKRHHWCAFLSICVNTLTLFATPAKCAVVTQKAASLEYFLALDRFTYYVDLQAARLSLGGKTALAGALAELTPEAVTRKGWNAKILAKVEGYDALITQWLKEEKPKLKFSEADVKWGYNFLKNKLKEAYVLDPVTPSAQAKNAAPLYAPDKPASIKPPIQPPGEPTLDVAEYMSHRTTRAVFWEANASGRPMEFYLGTYRSFYDDISSRGGVILGEVEARAANYNKIYLVQYPGEAEPRWAITQISGQDRLDHLLRQVTLAKPPAATISSNASKSGVPIQLYGSVAETHAELERDLTHLFEAVPKADKVIIGQKRAIETALRVNMQSDAVARLYSAYPQDVKARLSAEQLKFVERRAKAGAAISAPQESTSAWGRIYDAVEDLFDKKKFPGVPEIESFTISNASHDVSDLVLTTADGKKVRWRLISNMWGDEIVPVAKALKATGHANVVYAGTTGALPGSGLEVGDLVVPKEVIDDEGKLHILKNASSWPDGTKTGPTMTVTHVGSPYEETTIWVNDAVQAGAEAVELETSYLAEAFNGPDDRLRVFLLVSDEVGSENATLAQAVSSKREKAQDALMNHLFAEDKIVVPPAGGAPAAPIEPILEEGWSKRDIVSRYQLRQLALQKGQGSLKKSILKELVSSQPAFTGEFLEARLLGADQVLRNFMQKAGQNGIKPTVGIPLKLLDGTWNPKAEKLVVELFVASQEAETQLKAALQAYLKSDPAARKALELRVVRGPPPPSSVAADQLVDSPLMAFYEDAALRNYGLEVTEKASGGLKFTKVPMRNPNGACASAQPGCQLSFFAPDKNTLAELAKLDQHAPNGLQSLKNYAEQISNGSEEDRVLWKVTVVDSLPSGEMAEIHPEFKNGEVTVHLKITKSGAKNPLVVAEELAHMQQLAPAVGFDGKFFHIGQWIETEWNARAGDAGSKRLLAEKELLVQQHLEQMVQVPEFRKLAGLPEGLDLSAALAARKKHAEERLIAATKEAKRSNAEARKAFQARKGKFNELEAKAEKLNDLVAKNDRKAVRLMLEEYLPWEIMKPSERVMWTEWLEAIEHPDPKRSRVFCRGMDDDLIMRTPEGKVFGMSKVLTENQGNYTRRLRSLEASRAKIVAHFHLSGDPSLSYLMRAHAGDPFASQFISFTSNPEVALGFGNFRASIAKIDERRLFPNVYSGFEGELEIMAPVIVFPDEVVHYQEVPKLKKNASPAEIEAYGKARERFSAEYLAKVEELTGVKMTGDPDAVSKVRSDLKRKFFRQGKMQLQALFEMDPTKAPKGRPSATAQGGSGNNCPGLLKYIMEMLDTAYQ